PGLPVDVEVVEFMVNSDLEKIGPGEPNPATHGTGATAGLKAKRLREGAGVETEAKIDIPAAYVRFYKKGSSESLATFLFGSKVVRLPALDTQQELTVDGKTYELPLRPKRYYKPYTIYLKKFHFARYLGTDKPKNYSSELIVRDDDDPDQKGQEVTIRMNSPLRHRGETFYQGGFDPNTETTTILQVVDNPGWLVPYISCAMVTLGLIVHFSI